MEGFGPGSATRLEAAKAIVGDLLRNPEGASDSSGAGLERVGTAFSLVAAKGSSVLLVPMTEDRFAFEDALSYANPDSISSPGTDLESGLRAALASFTSSGAQGRVLFLFTDGGELSGSARRACEEAQARRARLVVVGMGGRKSATVPGPDGAPLAGPKGPVVSVQDSIALKAMAALAGGRYIDASDAGGSAKVESALAAELASGMGRGTRVEYKAYDRTGLFALLALACLIAAILASMLSTRGARA